MFEREWGKMSDSLGYKQTEFKVLLEYLASKPGS